MKRRLALAVGVLALLGGGTAVAIGATGSPSHPRHRHHGTGRHRLVRHAILTYLGLSARQLQAKRQSGQTLAQIADATSGRSAAGLEAAILEARRAKLPARVHSLLGAHQH